MIYKYSLSNEDKINKHKFNEILTDTYVLHKLYPNLNLEFSEIKEKILINSIIILSENIETLLRNQLKHKINK